MKPIYLQPNEARNGFSTKSDYTRSLLADYLKKYRTFEVRPVNPDSKKGRRFLEAAVIPAYCEWQYGIPARESDRDEQRRMLFKRDFHFDIVKNREGEPVRIPLSTVGHVTDINNAYTSWAQENGAPVPNADLFKLYRDKWKTDIRFENYFEWLEFLGITCDTMPSKQTLSKLDELEGDLPEYPDDEQGADPSKIPF